MRPRLRRCALAVSALLLSLALASCGGGGGGTTDHGSAIPPPPAPDFGLSLSINALTVDAGSITQQTTLTVSALHGFQGDITINAALPTGFACFPGSCTVVFGQPELQLSFVTSPTVVPGLYPVTLTCTSGALTHNIALNVTISPTPPIVRNRSAFFYTGDPNQQAAIFDSIRNVVYAPDLQHHVIHVLSVSSFKLLHDIDVPAPSGLDLSADGARLYAGSGSQYLYAIDPVSRAVVDRALIPLDHGVFVTASTVNTLSDDTVMLQLTNTNDLALYTPATRSFQFITPPPPFTTGLIARTSNHHTLYLGGSSGLLLRYDAGSGFTNQRTLPAPLGSIAVSPDGSRIALATSGLTILDPSLNTIANDPLEFPIGGIRFSADGSRIYTADGPYAQTLRVLDTNGNSLGLIPNVLLQPSSLTPPVLSDTAGSFLLSYTANGVALVDAGMAPVTQFTSIPFPGVFAPDNPAISFRTTFQSSNLDQTPLVFFNDTPAGSSILNDPQDVTIFAPNLIGQAQSVDVGLNFPDGFFILVPNGYAYGPSISVVNVDSSGEPGGGSLEFFGRGLDFQPNQIQVSVGGAAAQVTQLAPAGSTLTQVVATIPPGTQGKADITVTTPNGSFTRPLGFNYAARLDMDFPNSGPTVMTQDVPRHRLYWNGLTSLVAFSTDTNSVIQQVPLGLSVGDIALTADGSRLYVISPDEQKLSILDAESLTVLQQMTIPLPLPGIQVFPTYIAPAPNNKAFIVFEAEVPGCYPIYEFDLSTQTILTRNDAGPCPTRDASGIARSGDGQSALIGTVIWKAATDSFTPITVEGKGAVAANGDGSVFESVGNLFLSDGSLSSMANADPFDGLFDVHGEKMNRSGSLLYRVGGDRVGIFDVHHGHLLRTLIIPQFVTDFSNMAALAIDPAGKQLWIFTGPTPTLSRFTFDADPLSIGEVTVVGPQITILGSGFEPTSQVSVDGTPVSTQFTDFNTISATDGSLSSGSHRVTVTNADHETYTLDNAFTLPNNVAFSDPRRRYASWHRRPPADARSALLNHTTTLGAPFFARILREGWAS